MPKIDPRMGHQSQYWCLKLNTEGKSQAFFYNGLHIPRTFFSIANHSSQNSGSQITRRVDGISRLHAERDTDPEEGQADYEGDEPCGRSDVFLVSGSENGNDKHGRAQKLPIIVVFNNALLDLHDLLTSEKKQPTELM